MTFSLLIEKGDPAGTVFTLSAPGEFTIGRSRSAAFRLNAADASGLHARLLFADGRVRLENLSQFGTRVNHAPVTGLVALSPGQRIEIGKSTVLLFRQDDGARAPALDADAPTGEGPASPAGAAKPRAAADAHPCPTAGATRAVTGAAAARGAAAHADPSEGMTQALWTHEEGATEEGATRAMQTRAATPEEIEHLREVERKRMRRRISVGLSVALPLAILAVIFRPRTPPPETEIEWSKDAEGEYIDFFDPAPGGGVKDGGYDICMPGNNTFKKKTIEGGVLYEGFIARDLNVPMRVIVQEENEVRFVAQTRTAMIEDWMRQAAGSGGRWNFDRPSPSPAFFGRKNGIPYTRVTYLRDSDGTWFGVASVLRHGSRRIVARAEVPAAERVRAEKMMSAKLINPSDGFEFSFWEGVPVATKLNEPEVLAQVNADLERMAPATWVALEALLQSLLTQATQTGSRETVAEAVRLLTKLRERQALWFNSQQLSFDAAIMQGNLGKATKIAEFTKAVFSNMEDQRYFSVRKWNAEP